MRKFLILFVLFLLLSITSGVWAGSASVDVPVTINYIGGCVISTPDHNFGNVMATVPGTGTPAANYTLSFTCSSGTTYTISQINFIKPTNAAGKTIKGVLYKNADYTGDIGTTTPTIATGTGTGTQQQIVLYSKIFGNSGTGDSACTWTYPNHYCPEGTYSAIYTFRIVF